jgi:hypothetical protein
LNPVESSNVLSSTLSTFGSGVLPPPPPTAPVPDTLIVTEGLAGSLLAMVTVPVCSPAAVGEKRMIAFWNDPAPTLNGVPTIVEANRALELVIEFTVRVAFPLLRTTRIRSLV